MIHQAHLDPSQIIFIPRILLQQHCQERHTLQCDRIKLANMNKHHPSGNECIEPIVYVQMTWCTAINLPITKDSLHIISLQQYSQLSIYNFTAIYIVQAVGKSIFYPRAWDEYYKNYYARESIMQKDSQYSATNVIVEQRNMLFTTYNHSFCK